VCVQVKWVNCAEDKNTWHPRDELIDMGFEKMVIEVDAKEAAQAGLMAKPLTSLNVQKHMVRGRERDLSKNAR